jgi:hypothetical protein
MSAYYRRILDHALGALLRVQFTTEDGEVIDYAVVLLLDTEKGSETIRVYDAAHGHNEMHRHTRIGGRGPEPFFIAVPLEKECALRSEVERGYREMIEGWERQ